MDDFPRVQTAILHNGFRRRTCTICVMGLSSIDNPTTITFSFVSRCKDNRPCMARLFHMSYVNSNSLIQKTFDL